MTDKIWQKGKLVAPALLLPQWDGHMHSMPIRVYYEDTDAGGIVYHSCYVNYAERGRTEYLRALGFNQSQLTEDLNTLFVVKKMDIDFKRSAKLDDLLTLTTVCREMRGASFIMDQKIYCGDELLVTLDVKIAVVSTDNRPVRIPAPIATAMRGEK